MPVKHEDVWIDLNDPNRRAQVRRLRICMYGEADPYVHIIGCHNSGDRANGFTLRIPIGDLDRLADAIRKFTLGPLGRMATDAEERAKNNQEDVDS